MKTAGAGGILLIGVGVLLLQLAYSGRGAAVLSALRGSGANGGNTPAAPADSGTGAATSSGASGGGGGGFSASDTVVSRTENPDGTVTITWSSGATRTYPNPGIGGGDGALIPDTVRIW